jgi:DnaJ-domain-containing protein 1
MLALGSQQLVMIWALINDPSRSVIGALITYFDRALVLPPYLCSLSRSVHSMQALDTALQLQPGCADALWQRAAAHAAAGSQQASFLDLRRLSSLQPDYPGLMGALQHAAHACAQQRRAAVQAAPPPPRRYTRITRGAPASSGANGVSSDKGVGQQQLYQVLGLRCGASREEVRAAYKQLAARLHPDKQAQGTSKADRAAAEELFKAVSAAYQTLMG